MSQTIGTIPQLSDWLDSVADNTDEWSIKFGLPDTRQAEIHVFRNETEEVIINTFRWKETIFLRKLLHYGSNAKMRPVTWEEMFNELDAMIGTRLHMTEERELSVRMARQ